MKKILIAAACLLTTFSATPQAADAQSARGIIRFVGSVNKGPCDTPADTWQSHIGRSNGISPAGAGAMSVSNHCAGVEHTSSVSLASVPPRKGRNKAGVITITYL